MNVLLQSLHCFIKTKIIVNFENKSSLIIAKERPFVKMVETEYKKVNMCTFSNTTESLYIHIPAKT